MRLLYIAFPNSVHTRRWINHFKQKNDILLISFYPVEKIDGIDVKFLPAGNKNLALLKVPEVKRIIDEFKPDILHAHYASSCGFVASLTGFHPYILSVWGDDILDFPHRSPLHKWAVRKAIRTADHVTATSQMLAESANKLLKKERDIEVVPFGVDLEHYKRKQRSSGDTIHIGSVRKLKPKYGLEYLIRATAKLIESGYKMDLTIAGKGPLREGLEKLARDLGIGDKVHLTGFIENDKVVDLLYQLDIFVMPSVEEGETFGVAAVEAMATGLPVVASRIGGLPEVVGHNITGLLAQPASEESLAEALKTYIDNPKMRLLHGANARARVERLYDWSKNTQQLENIYRAILATPKK